MSLQRMQEQDDPKGKFNIKGQNHCMRPVKFARVVLPAVDFGTVRVRAAARRLAGLASLLWTGMFEWSKPGRSKAQSPTMRYVTTAGLVGARCFLC